MSSPNKVSRWMIALALLSAASCRPAPIDLNAITRVTLADQSFAVPNRCFIRGGARFGKERGAPFIDGEELLFVYPEFRCRRDDETGITTDRRYIDKLVVVTLSGIYKPDPAAAFRSTLESSESSLLRPQGFNFARSKTTDGYSSASYVWFDSPETTRVKTDGKTYLISCTTVKTNPEVCTVRGRRGRIVVSTLFPGIPRSQNDAIVERVNQLLDGYARAAGDPLEP